VPLPVKLQDVLEEMQMVSDEMTAYINLKTGELITITHEKVRLAEDSESEDDLPDWQAEMLPKVREVLDSKDFIPLPDKSEMNEWSIMQRFAASQQRRASSSDPAKVAGSARPAFRRAVAKVTFLPIVPENQPRHQRTRSAALRSPLSRKSLGCR